MRRFQGIEIEDQPWCPAALRDFATDYLEFVIARSRVYASVADRLAAALERTESKEIVDLCAGGGGPWASLLPALQATVPGLSVTFTDLYPNAAERDALGRWHPESVDARRVPADLPGFRTLFSSFHHFAPEDAAAILTDAVTKGEGIGVFEATRRHPAALIGMLLTPLAVWLVTPAIRPFRLSRLLMTFVLPLVPLLVLFDGFVSCLRTYSVDELRALAQTADPEGKYDWEIGVAPARTGPVTYLIGVPRCLSPLRARNERPGEGPGERYA